MFKCLVKSGVGNYAEFNAVLKQSLTDNVVPNWHLC